MVKPTEQQMQGFIIIATRDKRNVIYEQVTIRQKSNFSTLKASRKITQNYRQVYSSGFSRETERIGYTEMHTCGRGDLV